MKLLAAKVFSDLFYKVTTIGDLTKMYNKSLINRLGLPGLYEKVLPSVFIATELAPSRSVCIRKTSGNTFSCTDLAVGYVRPMQLHFSG